MGVVRRERRRFFEKLRVFFMMDGEKKQQQIPREAAGRGGGDPQALSREERFRCRWDEHYRFEQEQLQADWWLQEVRPLLAQAVPQAINGLPETLIGRFRDDLISSYAPAPEGKTVGFVTAERVAAFGQQLCEALQPLLKQLG